MAQSGAAIVTTHQVAFQPENEFPIIYLSCRSPHSRSSPLTFQQKRTKPRRTLWMQ